uniref:Uncharacterized protein n=1 Tax=viral metagenome TaxID=1070528 RepID=A0A2V0R8Y1_9ZZZZ
MSFHVDIIVESQPKRSCILKILSSNDGIAFFRAEVRKWQAPSGTRYNYAFSECEPDHLHIVVKHKPNPIIDAVVKDYDVEYIDPALIKRNCLNANFPALIHVSKTKYNYGEMMLVRWIMYLFPDLSNVVICLLNLKYNSYFQGMKLLDSFLMFVEILTGEDPVTVRSWKDLPVINASGCIQLKPFMASSQFHEFFCSPESGFVYHICHADRIPDADGHFMKSHESTTGVPYRFLSTQFCDVLNKRGKNVIRNSALFSLLNDDVLNLIEEYAFPRVLSHCKLRVSCVGYTIRHIPYSAVDKRKWFNFREKNGNNHANLLTKCIHALDYVVNSRCGRTFIASNRHRECYFFLTGDIYARSSADPCFLVSVDCASTYVTHFYRADTLLNSKISIRRSPSKGFTDAGNTSHLVVCLLSLLDKDHDECFKWIATHERTISIAVFDHKIRIYDREPSVSTDYLIMENEGRLLRVEQHLIVEKVLQMVERRKRSSGAYFPPEIEFIVHDHDNHRGAILTRDSDSFSESAIDEEIIPLGGAGDLSSEEDDEIIQRDLEMAEMDVRAAASLLTGSRADAVPGFKIVWID